MDKGFVAIHPISFPGLMETSPFWREAEDLMEGVMEMTDPCCCRASVMDSTLWSTPWPRRSPCCPRRAIQHFMILPRLITDADRSSEGSDQQCGKDTADATQYKSKDTTNKTSIRSKKSTPASDTSCKACSCTLRDRARSRTSPDTVRDREVSPWEFSVDVRECDEVRAVTEGGMLTVEGRGVTGSSRQMVRHVTSLPPHVTADNLTASLRNGRLTVTQKAGTQLEAHTRILPIEVQEQHESQMHLDAHEQQEKKEQTAEGQHEQQEQSAVEDQHKQQQQLEAEAQLKQQLQLVTEDQHEQQQRTSTNSRSS